MLPSQSIMKYILILYMCSMNTGQCPNSTISGYQFSSHYDCVNAGYALAQSTFRNLKEIEEWDLEYINKNKIVVKFDCKELGAKI
jgi:3-deoxy-D-arabino-heptulosonate 7-phosphate (DAHP) synthase class II